jgi:hypothetical protein
MDTSARSGGKNVQVWEGTDVPGKPIAETPDLPSCGVHTVHTSLASSFRRRAGLSLLAAEVGILWGTCQGSEVQFTSSRFVAAEGSTATITVTRVNGSVGVVKVDYCAAPGAFDTASGLVAISPPNGDFPPYHSRIRGDFRILLTDLAELIGTKTLVVILDP